MIVRMPRNATSAKCQPVRRRRRRGSQNRGAKIGKASPKHQRKEEKAHVKTLLIFRFGFAAVKIKMCDSLEEELVKVFVV